VVVLVDDCVPKDKFPRRINLENLPRALGQLALRSGQVVLDTAAGTQIERRHRRRVVRRTPPALELARICPELPDALRGCVKFGRKSQGQVDRVVTDAGHGHEVAS